MNLVIRHRDAEYEVELSGADGGGTVGELVSSMFRLSDPVVAVDGRDVSLSVPLVEAGLGTGVVIDVADAADPHRWGSLNGVAGDEAGLSLPLTAGTLSIGASPADVPIGGVPGRIWLHTDNSGTFSIRNGERMPVLVDGHQVQAAVEAIGEGSRIDVGGSSFVVSTAVVEGGRGNGVFNRPPRHVVRDEAVRLDPPPAPEAGAKAMRFGWGALIVPVVLGIAMAVLVHPRMAMFAVFSPAMLLANWLEDRRRIRKERRETGEAHRDAIRRFGGEVEIAYRRHAEALLAAAILPSELKGRAIRRDSRLWERRRDHEDFMKLPVGTGCLPWEPELSGRPSPEALAVLQRFGALHDVPVDIVLEPGAVAGIAGDRPDRLRVARQIVLQAATHHGPADLAISVFTERSADWDWAKWLPHVVADDSGRRRIAASEADLAAVVALLPGEDNGGPRHLLVVDLPDLVSGARPGIREALRGGKKTGISGIALAPQPLDLPSLSTTIVAVEGSGSWVRFPDGEGTEIRPWLLRAVEARAAARALARVDDPEASTAGAALPRLVHLASLLQLDDDLDGWISARWSSSTRRFSAPIGIAGDGPLVIDLVADGPHALLGGTTGAGKSELLRTMVASLAVLTSPDALNFVLIDYKGGSAFDACAGLPHTVGMVTDLDEHLAGRALSCLEAELRYRERRLRDGGVSDISEYTPVDDDPLPRLLVVVDEFAALAKELPDFIDALVGIAQRGRSLGVHMLLATQRPSGVISDNIKANTNLRIALRVQDDADSVDVIGCADAAAIGRGQPGRGLVRLGPRDVVGFQTALVTSRSLSAGGTGIGCRPFVFAHEQQPPGETGTIDSDAPSDLERLVEAARRVAIDHRLAPARRPWPDPLPGSVFLDELAAPEPDCGGTPFALADEPHRQRRVAVTWSPMLGNLLMYGVPGSGTTSAMATLVVGLARSNSPDRLHIYVLDFDDQLLAPLGGLPHVGAVVGVNEKERQLRLLRRLAQELQSRRHAIGADPDALSSRPTIVTMLDNYGGFAGAFDDPGDLSVRNHLTRLVADGPGVGMFTIATAKQPTDVPTRLASLVAAKLAFRLADRYEYSGLGVPAVEPPVVPGRAFESGSGREIQVAVCHPGGVLAAVAEDRWSEPMEAPWSIETLPLDVDIADVIQAARVSPDEWFLPLGIGDAALTPAGLILREGEHALIAGPARSGKSTALATIATVARAAHPGLRISAVVPRRSPLSDCPVVDDVLVAEDLGVLDGRQGGHLILVDDAELVGDSPFLFELVRSRKPDMRVIAAGSADAIRGLYGHWTQDVRRSRIGCALRPNIASDGELWQTQLPRRGPDRFPVGRGYLLADGQAELVQLGA